MRTVIYGAACSLDGFIAGPHDEVDWLHWSDEVAAISRSVWERVDTVLMGRKTYQVAVRNGVRAYPDVKNFVFSRTLAQADATEVTVVDIDPATFVRGLKNEPGSGICVMGGGVVAQSLLDAGLVDEIGVNVQPVILGDGIPLLARPTQRHHLSLKEHRVLDGGSVYLLYNVTRDDD